MSEAAANPLLNWGGPTPPWDRIRAAHLEPAVDAVLAQARAQVQAVIDAGEHSWAGFAAPLERIDARLHEAFSPGGHLHSVCNDEAWRSAYEACLPKLTEYATQMGQNRALYAGWQALAKREDLDPAQRKLVDNTLRDFRLSGVDLPPAQQQRYAQIQQRLAELSNRFESQLIDATDAWQLHLPDTQRLAGLPESALALGRSKAQAKGLEGYVYGLDYPSFDALISHADDRALREQIYTAYVTRASDQGPQAGEADNRPLMDEILALRHEEAQLLGQPNYAALSLLPKMADSPQAVERFLLELAERARPAAQQQLQALSDFAAAQGAELPLASWDVGYWAEKHRDATLGLSDEKLRPYFALPRVLEGLFAVTERLFGVRVEAAELPVWHADAQGFAVFDAQGTQIAWFFIDLYAREKKRGGAWMDDCAGRHSEDGHTQLPIATLTCNFRAPTGEGPALLTHDEVLTLFHEFGHGLHHMLTRVEVPGVAGIHGVAWDAVELPSQFLENWCWEREALDLFARHIDNDSTLPGEMLTRLRESRRYNAGLATLRQVEFSLFDLRLHRDYNPAAPADIEAVLGAVRDEVALLRPPAWNRFANSFGHIFAGGYAAGYYSYKWAEVLSADAFAAFREEGLFNPQTGARFRDTILARGGSADAAELFRAFRGRDPQVDALLAQDGLLPQAA